MSELRIFVLDATAGVAWVVDSLSGEVLGEGDGGDASTVVKEVLKDAITACGVPDVMVLHVPAETVATASRGRVRHKQERLRAHRDFLPEEQS